MVELDSIPASTQLLRACTCLELDQQRIDQIKQLVASPNVWKGLAQRSEQHGMAPLLYRHLKQLNVAIPDSTALQLKSLVLRHQQATKVRTHALTEILQAFESQGISTIVLKGAALAYTVYPAPELRPMSDIDILVDKEKCNDAQRVLTSLGYSGADLIRPGAKFDHHHMAIAKKIIDGLTISVEVHRDAIAPDARASISMKNLVSEVENYSVDEVSAQHLGHADMLQHLCRHLAEPMMETKLISIVDVYAYCAYFDEDIDWLLLKQNHPIVENTIRCLHYVSSMPMILQRRISPPTVPAPPGVGRGIPTLSSVPWSIRDFRRSLKYLTNIVWPPAWWWHLYYAVPPEQNASGPIRCIRHWTRIGFWMIQRIRSTIRYAFYRVRNQAPVDN